MGRLSPVSYTHLDVYKRQGQLKGLDCNRAADFVEILEIIDRDLGLGLASGIPVSVPPATVDVYKRQGCRRIGIFGTFHITIINRFITDTNVCYHCNICLLYTSVSQQQVHKNDPISLFF